MIFLLSPRKFQRLFWVLIVIAGFSGATFLIHQSFKSWAESPIATVIENQPISKLTFPKITVCPPKNTFTNLNYDLIKTENISMDNKIRQELKDYFYELNHDQKYEDVLKEMNILTYENRYDDWYKGYTELLLPTMILSYDKVETLSYSLRTSSHSGKISSQYFGEKFDSKKVQKEVLIFLEFYFDGISRVNNITFIFNTTKETLQLADGFDKVLVNKHGQLPEEMKQVFLRVPVTDKLNDVVYSIQ